MKEGVYHSALIDPWKMVDWGLQKAGLSDLWIVQQLGLGSSSGSVSSDKLMTERFVILENLEVSIREVYPL